MDSLSNIGANIFLVLADALIKVSPHLVGMENEILSLHFHMTYVPARGGAAFIGLVSGRRWVKVKLGVAPSPGPRKSLADLLHEEKVRQSIRHVYDERGFRALFRLPLDLCDL